MFTTAVVKQPCKNIVNGITEADLGRPDYDLACRQHQAYIKALETCGLNVITLGPEEAYPDSVFIEDTCLVTPRCTIITNPGATSRKGEISSVKEAMTAFDLPLEEITAPGTLDAGDIMMVGSTFYVGLSERTNANGFAQLEALLKRYEMKAVAVPLDSVLHLKTGVSYLEDNNLLAWGEFMNKKELLGFSLIEVGDDEAYAANSVWINGNVLVPKGFERTRDLISAAGYTVIEVDVSEFRKLDGGLSCLSLRF